MVQKSNATSLSRSSARQKHSKNAIYFIQCCIHASRFFGLISYKLVSVFWCDNRKKDDTIYDYAGMPGMIIV